MRCEVRVNIFWRIGEHYGVSSAGEAYVVTWMSTMQNAYAFPSFQSSRNKPSLFWWWICNRRNNIYFQKWQGLEHCSSNYSTEVFLCGGRFTSCRQDIERVSLGLYTGARSVTAPCSCVIYGQRMPGISVYCHSPVYLWNTMHVIWERVSNYDANLHTMDVSSVFLPDVYCPVHFRRLDYWHMLPIWVAGVRERLITRFGQPTSLIMCVRDHTFKESRQRERERDYTL